MPDEDLDVSRDPDPRMSSGYRWRPAFQADFQARLDWRIRPSAEANHPPIVRVAGDRVRPIAPGEAIDLAAGGSSDPDGDELDHHWGVYPGASESERRIVIEGANGARARLVVGPELAGSTIPVLLSVTDRGEPRLTRYGRILFRVSRSD